MTNLCIYKHINIETVAACVECAAVCRKQSRASVAFLGTLDGDEVGAAVWGVVVVERDREQSGCGHSAAELSSML